jgi:hypothetical protein
MRDSLFDYIDMKIHPLLKEREYKNIWVIGNPDRSSGISKYEKQGKLFNWQRPTAEIQGDDLYIRVFPGREYVKHYATLIATYFLSKKRSGDTSGMFYPKRQMLGKH